MTQMLLLALSEKMYGSSHSNEPESDFKKCSDHKTTYQKSGDRKHF